MADARDIAYWRGRLPGKLGHEIEKELDAGRLSSRPESRDEE